MDDIGDRVATDLEEFAGFLEGLILADKGYLIDLADALDDTVREGADVDEPEGARWITFSDTLARQISARLRAIAGGLSEAE